MYFTHTIGPAPLGDYYLFLAYFGIFNLIVDGGFGGDAVKRISERTDQNEYMSAFVFLIIILLSASVSALILMISVFKIISSGMFYWFLLAMIISVFSKSVANTVYGRGSVGIFQISTFADTASRTVVQIIVVFLGFAFAGLAGGFLIGLTVGGLLNFRYMDLKLVRFKMSHVKNLLGFSLWIFLSSSGYAIKKICRHHHYQLVHDRY
jgi:O-antigen/teichoic acid export membrane protein